MISLFEAKKDHSILSQRMIGLNREWLTSLLESMSKEFLACHNNP